jgi:hypothetical protein
MDEHRSFPGGNRDSFLFATASRPTLELTVSYLTGLGDLSAGVMRSGREVNHSPLCRAEVKNAWSCNYTSPHVITACCLIKHRIRLHGEVLR